MVDWRVGDKNGGSKSPVRGMIAAVDIGTTKTCCIIAKSVPATNSKVLTNRSYGVHALSSGYSRSWGVKSGVITNLDEVEQIVRKVVGSAEREIGCTLESLIVNLSAGRISSKNVSSFTQITGNEVRKSDINRLLAMDVGRSLLEERSVIHIRPITFAIDANSGVRNPIGMVGRQLRIDSHVVSADTMALDNVELCLNRCHLDVAAMVASAYASGLAVLVDDEMEIGAIVIDMGGGTTSAAVFIDGGFIHSEMIAVGARHITMDIARSFSIGIADAERLKTLHGSALPGFGGDDDEMITMPIADDLSSCERTKISHIDLTRVIRARLEEIFETLRERFIAAGVCDIAGHRIVLTGGGSQLIGCAELARQIIAKNVRRGRPLGLSGLSGLSGPSGLGLSGLSDHLKGPEFACVSGLLLYPQCGEALDTSRRYYQKVANGNYWHRVGNWLRDNF